MNSIDYKKLINSIKKATLHLSANLIIPLATALISAKLLMFLFGLTPITPITVTAFGLGIALFICCIL